MITCPVCNKQSTVEDWKKTEEAVYGKFDRERNCIEALANWADCPKCGKRCFYGSDITEGGLEEDDDLISIM